MTQAAGCPLAAGRDDRKTAAIAAARAHASAEAQVVPGFSFAREILRSPKVVQAGAGADEIPFDNPDHISVFFLDGELHKKRRSQLARYFTPKAISERHQLVMERTTAQLIAQLRGSGRERLDLLSFQLACDVAAEIVGLTDSNPRGLADRILMTFRSLDPGDGKKFSWFGKLRNLYHTARFFWIDIRPAVRLRRKQAKEDVLSYMVAENYSNQSILIECMTYATAGMMTTREFIVMVAWHLLERDDLRQRFLGGDQQDQLAILDEILRIDPVATFVYRRPEEDVPGAEGEIAAADGLYAIDIRQANTDETVTGPCPFAIDPDRARRQRMTGSWMSFGDGPHRCPGAQVALHETRVFIDALLRVPGIRLANPPGIEWSDRIMGYELHGAYVECDRH